MATDNRSAGPQPVKRNDAYTGLLAISFLAMVGGCVLLYLEYDQYEGRNPPPMPKIDVPGTLRPAPTAPKDSPPPKAKEVETPAENPKTDKDKPKEKTGKLFPDRLEDELVIPLPDPARLPEGRPTMPAQAGRDAANPQLDLIIPASAAESSKINPGVKAEPKDLPLEPVPVLPEVGSEQSPTKIPATNIPPKREPSIDDAPPLPVKPFVPPM